MSNVEAISAGEGRGAIFIVKLPLMAMLTESRRISRPQAAGPIAFDCPPQLDGLRILVIDDEPDVTAIIAAVLAACRAEVKTVVSAAEAFEVMKRWLPDLIVCDIGMPEESGYEFMRKVRAMNADRANIPAVALTAYTSNKDRMQALAAGFHVHVPKPVEPSELVRVLANLVTERDPHRDPRK